MTKIIFTIPFFNEEDTIFDTLSSLIYKPYIKNYGIILINNNSTDKSLKIIKMFSINNPKINIYYSNQARQGVFFSRKLALDTALKMGAETIVGCDADTIFNNQLISEIISFSKDKHHDVFAGKISIPLKDKLYRYIYFPEFEKLTRLLWYKEFQIFGPYFFGACFAIKTNLYKKIKEYYKYKSLIIHEQMGEDILLSKRAYYMGGVYLNSKSIAVTSSRRFFSDPINWLTSNRKGNIRTNPKKIDRYLLKYVNKNKLFLYTKKIENVSDRWLRTAIDASYFYEKTHKHYPRAKEVVDNWCRFFNIPYNEFLFNIKSSPIQTHKNIKFKYFKIINKRVENYLQNNLKLSFCR